MRKWSRYFKWGYGIFVCAMLLSGCSGEHSTEERIAAGGGKEEAEEREEEKAKQQEEDSDSAVFMEEDIEDTEDIEDAKVTEHTENENEDTAAEPEIVYADWSAYFNGLNGTAVVYDASDRRYTIYKEELAVERRSPCSTFKIISSLTALEHGTLVPEDSTRPWSGESFWNEDWNKDMDFGEAFRTSCVWYYRQLIDDIGKDRMQEELQRLSYGNCDISDWEGRLNTNNNNRALTGFWLESSLLISPKEQTEVLERIFGEDSEYSEEIQKELKQVMLVTEPEQDDTDLNIYGKTGMGKADGIVVDAWFTGFAESAEGKLYFCVRLGRTDGREGSSSLAKEIAIRIVADYDR